MTASVLTQDDVAALLDCDVETVQRRALAGDLPGVKFGRGWIFPQEALIERLNTMAREESAKRRKRPAAAVQPVAGRRRGPVPLPEVAP